MLEIIASPERGNTRPLNETVKLKRWINPTLDEKKNPFVLRRLFPFYKTPFRVTAPVQGRTVLHYNCEIQA